MCFLLGQHKINKGEEGMIGGGGEQGDAFKMEEGATQSYTTTGILYVVCLISMY